jgi:hypothetical protein
VGLFRKRKALDPLVVDPVAAQSSISPQDNATGPSAPGTEAIAHSEEGSDGLVAGRWGEEIPLGTNATLDPKSVEPLLISDEETKDD